MIIVKILLGFWPLPEILAYVFGYSGYLSTIFFIIFYQSDEKYKTGLYRFVSVSILIIPTVIIEIAESRKVYAWFLNSKCQRENFGHFVDFMYTFMIFDLLSLLMASFIDDAAKNYLEE